MVTTKLLVRRERASIRTHTRLWDEAHKLLESDEAKILEHATQKRHATPHDVQIAVQDKLDDCERGAWTISKTNGDKVAVRSVLEEALKWVRKYEIVVDSAVSYDVSGHAAAPWTLVKVLLGMGLNSIETMKDMLDGVEYTLKLVALYTEVEINSLRGTSHLKTQLATALVALYSSNLRYLCRAYRYFGERTVTRVLKGVFQSSDMVVAPLLLQTKRSEEEVIKIVSRVEAQGQCGPRNSKAQYFSF